MIDHKWCGDMCPHRCDDCRKTYTGQPYYTFDEAGCNEVDIIDGAEVAVEHDCTGNLCPECAGPFLDPDEGNDPLPRTFPALDIAEVA